MDKEIIIDIKGYEGRYKVSNHGYVISLVYGKYKRLKGGKDSNGYPFFTLTNGKCVRASRLVALHFVDNPNGYYDVNHKDGNKLNNHFSNLEFVSKRENSTHRNTLHGKSKNTYVGVARSKNGRTWNSRVRINGQRIYLGNFKTELEAHTAYVTALKDRGLENRYATNPPQ